MIPPPAVQAHSPETSAKVEVAAVYRHRRPLSAAGNLGSTGSLRRALSYIRPLRCGSCGRGPAWFPRTGSKSVTRARSPAAKTGSSGPVFPTLALRCPPLPAHGPGTAVTATRSLSSPLLRSFSGRPSGRGHGPPSVVPHGMHPHNPGHPVRKCDRGHLERRLLDHPRQPEILNLPPAPLVANYRGRAEDKQVLDVAPHHLRDPAEPLAAARQMLPRRQTRPGGEVAPVKS